MAAPAYLDLPGSADDATQVPCAFDFTTGVAASSAGEIPLTVTRAGATATRVNAAGLIETVAANTARLDYDPVTLGCKGILIEESRTNLLQQSASIGTAPWNIAGTTTVTPNALASPDGTVTASSINETAVTNQFFVNYGAGVNGTTYTFSVFAKRGSRNWLRLEGGAGGGGAWFDLLNGVVGTVAANSASISPYGNGWYRCTITRAMDVTQAFYIFAQTQNGEFGYAGTGGLTGVYVWGAQVEQASFATSYIPTTSAAVTRNVDLPNVASLGSWFNSAEGTIFSEFITPSSGTYGSLFEFDDGTTGNRIRGIVEPGRTVNHLVQTGAVVQANFNDGTVITAGAIARAGWAYKANDFPLSVNGTAPVTDTAGTVPAVTKLWLGTAEGGGGLPLNGHLRKLAYIPKRLLNATLQSISLNGLALKQYAPSTTRAPSRPGFPQLPPDTPAGLRQFLVHLKEIVETRNAELGSPLDSNPTYRDLINTGLIKVADNVPLLAAGREFTLDTKTWLTSNIPQWVTDNTLPPAPTGLVIFANTAGLTLSWDSPTFANYKQTLIYRASSNNLSNAVVIGSNTGHTYVDDLPPSGTAYYYWIRHESKSELTSNFNSTNGTTVGNTPGAPVLSYTFAGENLVLSWTTPTSNLAIQYYEVSWGATPGANPVGVTQANTLRIRVDYGGTRTYWVRAIDINFGLGTAGSQAVTINAPGTPSLVQTLTGGSLVFALSSAAGSLPISYYDFRYGASWAAGTLMGISLATRYEINVNWTGARTFYAVAFDTAGNQSGVGQVTFTPTLPVASALTAQVIDNNVLLRWSQAPGSLPIDHSNVYRDSTLIGADSALFAAVFESVAGTYVYKVEPIDTAGNVGTVSTITAVVAAPPDFVLYSNIVSTYSGTKTSCFKELDTGILYANVDTAETFQSHFTSRGWNTPQDQITAGYSRYLVGKTTGSYLEKVDYGVSIPSTKITMTPTTAFSDGTVSESPTLSTSPDDITYTNYPGVFSVYATAFRYVKYKIDFSASHNGSGLATDTSNLIGIKPLAFNLDVKLKTKEGVMTANSGDASGTNVDITGMFIDVSSINLTPLSTTAKHPTYDFSDVPNPTGFKVYLWNDSGSRVSGDVSWVVRGV